MNTTNKPEILSRLEKCNSHNDSIKIRARAKKPAGFTVYFDFYNKGSRTLKYIDKKLHFDGTPATLAADKEKLKIIVAMRNQLQNDQLKSDTGFSLSAGKDKDFLIYFESVAKDTNWHSPINHFKNFANGKKITFDSINRVFCAKFAEYLQARLKTNSAITFYQKFKAALNRAVKEDIITKNPAASVTMKKADTKREFLSFEEIKTLSRTDKPNLDSCNAFLFSCFTGLRISDLRSLTFAQIKDNYIEFKQQKTGQNERFKLSSAAQKIVSQQAEFCRSDKVFNLITLGNINVHVDKWAKAAGINKYITFHCARHTFATMALTNDIDLYTVSKLLGHRDIKTTQIYAKLIDKKKDEAIDKLPDMDI